MLHFDCDYMEGAHPAIMARLSETNFEQTPGYGFDEYSAQAKEKIRVACARPEAGVSFLVGGTQANATVIDAFLRPWNSVLCVETGHIALHEAGAIEASGHKVVGLPQAEGKLRAATAEAYLEDLYADPTHEHMTIPGMVYLSHPSEFGTLYTKAELKALRCVCDEYGLPLFIDGARLGYGLVGEGSDVSLEDIARIADAFTIGGTKVGALFGEAVVFSNPTYAEHFFTLTKQHGALLAKGRLLGLQFDTLFTNGLYFEIARHGVAMAMKLKKELSHKGYQFFVDSPTNQQFVVLRDAKIEQLEQKVTFERWQRLDGGSSVVRLATSWATREENVDALIDLF